MATPLQNSILGSRDVADEDEGAPILESATMEEQLAMRAEKRLLKAEEIHAKAEVFRRMGDELSDAKKYEEALIPYIEASRIWPSNTSYFIQLSTTYFKLQWYEEAAHAATRALTLEPTSIEARYTRARARLEQRLPLAARVDLETVVAHDPSHHIAKETLSELNKAIDIAKAQHSVPEPSAQELIDFSYPHYEEDPIDLDTVSNSSDCNHPGNGIPCKFYNHGRCGKGAYCPYSHAPDEKSVRDDLGRNVCTYFLLDTCKFGETKCVYSHSREFLPKRGWWTDPAKTAKVKSVVELAEKTAKEQRSIAQAQQKRQASKSSKTKAETPTATGDAKSDGQKAVEAAVLIDGGKEKSEKGVPKPESKGKQPKSSKPVKQSQTKEEAKMTAVGNAEQTIKPKGRKRPIRRNTKPSPARKSDPSQDSPVPQDATAPTPAPVVATA